MNKILSGADILLRSLVCEGVDMIFGYPGGSIMPVYDRLYDYSDRLSHILVRHEQGATHAAQGYARVTGRTGVVITTSGPGATNIITGVADAAMDSTPMVVITGQVASPYLGYDAFQESDVVGITQPVAKWSYQIRRPQDVAWAVARAFYIASSGRPGPVVLDFTKDAQVGMAGFDYRKCDFIRSYDPLPKVDMDAIKAAADLINTAQRPMILSGHGVMIANAERQLVELAEKSGIPVAATLLGLSTIPSGHPLYKGMLGMHGNIGPNVNTNRADLLVAVGMRFDDRITATVENYAPQAKIIHIDIDSSEFGKIVHADVPIHADARQALEALIPMVEKRTHSRWVDSFDRHEQVERVKVMEPELNRSSEKMSMGEVVAKVSEAAGHRMVVVTDVGQNQMFSARYSRFVEPKSIVTSGGLGTMGFGLPAAIGAKLGAPHRTVCFFTGDGGLQMTIQELGVILEYGVDVKIILLNNNFLGNVRQWQSLFFNGRFSQTHLVNPDFKTLAAAYGIAAEDVASRDQLDAAIGRMLTHEGAYLLNVNIDESDMIFPMIPPGGTVDKVMLNASEYYKPED